jgi:hypothetical protein
VGFQLIYAPTIISDNLSNENFNGLSLWRFRLFYNLAFNFGWNDLLSWALAVNGRLSQWNPAPRLFVQALRGNPRVVVGLNTASEDWQPETPSSQRWRGFFSLARFIVRWT